LCYTTDIVNADSVGAPYITAHAVCTRSRRRRRRRRRRGIGRRIRRGGGLNWVNSVCLTPICVRYVLSPLPENEIEVSSSAVTSH